MDKSFLRILFLFLLMMNLNFSADLKNNCFKGRIIDHDHLELMVNKEKITVDEKGEFIFKEKSDYPNFYMINYGLLEWIVYVEPGKILEITLSKNQSLDQIEYTGKFQNENNFLKIAKKENNALNQYFNNNWVNLHQKAEKQYIQTLDSLKGIFLNKLERFHKDTQPLGENFIRYFKTDLDYGFNSLILDYPKNHLICAKKEIELSEALKHRIKECDINNPEYFNLENYKNYTKSYINNLAENKVNEDQSSRHYNLKKMEIYFEIIPKIFNDHYRIDQKLTDLLIEHIENHRIQNSQEFIELHKSICKTAKFQKQLEEYIASINQQRSDHRIEAYKTENDFILEVHIFNPEEFDEKGNYSCFIFVHGGGWIVGNPTWGFGKCKHYSKLGMVAISTQYRLSNNKDISPKEAMEDIRDLVLWARQNADRLNINPEKIAIEGWSAGGHLSISTAVFPKKSKNEKFTSIPNAVILNSAALDLTNDGWFGQLLSNTNFVSRDLSPADNVTKGLPPTLILQGREDSVTPFKGAKLFHQRMIENHNRCDFIVYDHVGHLFTPSHLNDQDWPQPDPETMKKATDQADQFLVELGFINNEQ